MYFSIVLVFLLTLEFIQMQMNRSRREIGPGPSTSSSTSSSMDDLIPFDYPFTEETVSFLERVTKGVRIFPLEELKMKIQAEWKAIVGDDLSNVYFCKTEKSSHYPFIELVEDQCTPRCNETNPTYVTVLNDYIHNLQDSYFNDNDTSILKLNAVPSNINTMCVDSDEDEYLCLCRVSYEIRVSKTFYLSFINIVHEGLTRDPSKQQKLTVILREKFSALAILLKFYPQGAFFYLCYLLYERGQYIGKTNFAPRRWDDVHKTYKLVNENNHFLPLQLSEFIPNDDASGMVESKETELEGGAEALAKGIQIRIFMDVYNQIVNRKFDIKAMAKKYYTKLDDRPEAFTVFWLLFQMFYLIYVRIKAFKNFSPYWK